MHLNEELRVLHKNACVATSDYGRYENQTHAFRGGLRSNGDEEERFETGVRRSALDFVQHDKNADKMLDYDEYCALVREREEARGGHTDEELRLRFDDLDDGKTGRVSLHSYIRASLREALSRSATRVIDLFRLWDEDGSGTIERKEFRRAIRALGFDFFANNAEIDLVFDDFDIDGSGKLEYKELNTMLRQGQSVRLADELLNGAAGAITTGAAGAVAAASDAGPWQPRMFERCAVVGSGHDIRCSPIQHGHDIDSADAVFRSNAAQPSKPSHPHVFYAHDDRDVPSYVRLFMRLNRIEPARAGTRTSFRTNCLLGARAVSTEEVCVIPRDWWSHGWDREMKENNRHPCCDVRRHP